MPRGLTWGQTVRVLSACPDSTLSTTAPRVSLLGRPSGASIPPGQVWVPPTSDGCTPVPAGHVMLASSNCAIWQALLQTPGWGSIELLVFFLACERPFWQGAWGWWWSALTPDLFVVQQSRMLVQCHLRPRLVPSSPPLPWHRTAVAQEESPVSLGSGSGPGHPGQWAWPWSPP